VIREYAFLRLFRLDVYNKAYFDVRPLFDEIARRLNVTSDELLYLVPGEVTAYVTSRTAPDLNAIRDRQRGFAIFRLNGGMSLIAGDDFAAFQQSRRQEEYGHLNEVQGDPIVAGEVTGIARVVLDSSDLGKVNRGDIL